MKRRDACEKKGGRKSYLDSTPEVVDAIETIVQDHTAGDPTKPVPRWTYLSVPEITIELMNAGFIYHDQTVARILQELGFSRRHAEKTITRRHFPQRDEQFQIISNLKRQYQEAGDPIFSIDTKKKEYLGNFHRPGQFWGKQNVPTYDHDFHNQGRVVPHGIYDLLRNTGHLTLGLSADTSEFACDSFAHYWRRYGQRHYPRANSVLWLCDCGGSNNPRHHLFKQDLQRLVNKIGIPIRVAHYPPYCSKYNPIERRLFSHVTRACAGVIFHTLDIVKKMIQRTTTLTGLGVTTAVIETTYHTGRSPSRRMTTTLSQTPHTSIPLLNYTLSPTH